MAPFAATADHLVLATDIHIVIVPTPGGPAPVPLPHPFVGTLDGGLISSVKIGGKPAAVVGSSASNAPSHLPTPPGVSFQKPPTNKATVMLGSSSVLIGGKPAARHGDSCLTCNDPADLPAGSIVAAGTVLIS
jgi:uncharacterized Zn-binding protein involved in type VI secretion